MNDEISIDREAWKLMQRERVEAENKIARLREQRDRLLEALRHVEWTQVLGEDAQRCPSCGLRIDQGHHPACQLALAIDYAHGEEKQ